MLVSHHRRRDNMLKRIKQAMAAGNLRVLAAEIKRLMPIARERNGKLARGEPVLAEAQKRLRTNAPDLL
jgi:hypothetical protein